MIRNEAYITARFSQTITLKNMADERRISLELCSWKLSFGQKQEIGPISKSPVIIQAFI
jgi:hypothetical protein